tara:strand:+ start:420 stop:740 length:321 start_codon:yes stop_codon:yes gene_type:complete
MPIEKIWTNDQGEIEVNITQEAEDKRKEESLKSIRDNFSILVVDLLKRSDWTAVSDVRITEEEKLEARAYREELRDIFDNIKNQTEEEIAFVELPETPQFIVDSYN